MQFFNNFYIKIVDKICYYLDTYYYRNLKKLYPDTQLNELLLIKKLPILKPDYFIFLQYYFIYQFFHNITNNNTIRYTISLHSFYLCDMVYDKISLNYNYISKNNIIFLKNNSFILFMYLFFFKILFLEIYTYKKFILLILFIKFYILIWINDLYKARLKSIELKNDFYHPLKILLITPNINTIKNIIHNTNYFTMTSYILFINVCLILFI
jgi:hypothetical protein